MGMDLWTMHFDTRGIRLSIWLWTHRFKKHSGPPRVQMGHVLLWMLVQNFACGHVAGPRQTAHVGGEIAWAAH